MVSYSLYMQVFSFVKLFLLSFLALVPSTGQALAKESSNTKAQSQPKSMVVEKIDWASFLAPKDMLWKKAPNSWENAPFLGNGLIGMQLFRDPKNAQLLRLEVARMDATEHAPYAPAKEGKGDWLYNRYRVPLGYFTLNLEEDIKDWDLRLELWDAQLTGTVSTQSGKTYALNAYVHATSPFMEIAVCAPQKTTLPSWEWTAYPNKSPRGCSRPKETPKADEGLAGSLKSSSGASLNIWKQDLRPSGSISTGWIIEKKRADKQTLFISIAHTYPQDTSQNEVTQTLKKATQTPIAVRQKTHKNWWHSYYPEAFVSLPDEYWDAFYWAQIYKIGAGMRENGPVLDLQGPWTGLPKNAWPGIWWNLNVQLTYWPCYTGNRLSAAKSLSQNLKKNRSALIGNVKKEYQKDSAGLPRCSGHDFDQPTGIPEGGPEFKSEIGCLLWVCHNLFLEYQMQMDDTFLKEEVYPLLVRAVNYHRHFLKKEADGKWHLPSTHSPEYGNAADCNYDLALLRWGTETLLWIHERLTLKDPLAPTWQDILDNLTDFPTNENGYMVGKNTPFSRSHRHYSHLFMCYPLHIVDTTQPEKAALVEKSILHWHSLKSALQGYSFTGGASLYATLGKGDEALQMLNGLKSYLLPNTLYKEQWPVIETPLSGAASLHDMLLLSHKGLIQVLPALPESWQDLTFHNLRAQGAFLVSLQKEKGKLVWLRIQSLAGEPMRLKAPMGDELKISGSGASFLKKDPSTGEWKGTPPKGSEVLWCLPGKTPLVKPLPSSQDAKPVFGMK